MDIITFWPDQICLEAWLLAVLTKASFKVMAASIIEAIQLTL